MWKSNLCSPRRLKPSGGWEGLQSNFVSTRESGSVDRMQWHDRCLLFLVVMNGLTTDFVDSCARQLGAKRFRLQLPWEQPPLEDVLRQRPASIIQKPDWVDFPLQIFDPVLAVSKPTKLDRYNARVHLSDVSWVAAETHQQNMALQCWKVIVLDSTCNTALGRVLMACIEQGRSDDYVWQVISDSFAGKSTATLRARSASLLAFGRWKKATFLGETSGIFPIKEEVAYEYLCHLRRLHSAPSKGKRFVEALGFAKGLVGADVSDALNSARVKGVAYGTEAAPTRKKSPFTVQQLVQLERMAFYGEGQEAIFCGYICFLVHARLRWSDGQHCIQEPTLDVTDGRGFIEAALYHHKTSKKRRTNVVRLLPVAGVLPGLSGLNWAEEWLIKRKQLGLKASMSQPTMPAPVAGGGWTLQPLTATEASTWLREILRAWSPVSLKDVATHSAKTTLLSWMSKAHVSLSLRRLAGYHVVPGDKSALEYSRDAAAPILRQIEAILISIRAGIFQPDEARSRRWHGAQTLEEAVKLAASFQCTSSHDTTDEFVSDMFGPSTSELFAMDPEAENLVKEVGNSLSSDSKHVGDLLHWSDDTTLESLMNASSLKRSLDVDNDFSFAPSDMSDGASSMSSSDDSDSNSEDLDRRVEIDGERNASDLVAPSDLAGRSCFKHVKSGKLHFVGKEVEGVKIFKCGRKFNSNYLPVQSVPAFTAHGCMTCFGWSDARKGDDSSE